MKTSFQPARTAPTLAESLLGRLRVPSSAWPVRLIQVVLGSMIIAACAQIRVYLPFTPVPVTMQTFGVLVVAASLGCALGGMATVLYVAEGLAGLPVFAGAPNAGLAVLLGPTGGFLVGFVIAAAFVGRTSDIGLTRRWLPCALVMSVGTALIFVPGVLWYAALTGSIGVAVADALAPFLPGAALKIALATLVLPGAWTLLGAQRGR